MNCHSHYCASTIPLAARQTQPQGVFAMRRTGRLGRLQPALAAAGSGDFPQSVLREIKHLSHVALMANLPVSRPERGVTLLLCCPNTWFLLLVRMCESRKYGVPGQGTYGCCSHRRVPVLGGVSDVGCTGVWNAGVSGNGRVRVL